MLLKIYILRTTYFDSMIKITVYLSTIHMISNLSKININSQSLYIAKMSYQKHFSQYIQSHLLNSIIGKVVYTIMII